MQYSAGIEKLREITKPEKICAPALAGFHQLDSIAEGIVDINAAVAHERFAVPQ